MFGSSSYSVYIISFFFFFLVTTFNDFWGRNAGLDTFVFDRHKAQVKDFACWFDSNGPQMMEFYFSSTTNLPINCKCVCGVIDSFTYFVYVVYTYILKWWSTPRNCVPINLIFAVSIHINSRFHTHTQCILFHYIFLLYIFLVYFFFVHERTAGPGRVKCRQSIMV